MEKLFLSSANKVAPLLLGQYLCRRFKDGKVGKYMITEVEAYVGEKDKACHAYHGRTERTKIMYGPPGYWYIYLVYGMHYMLNLVVSPVGEPQAILLRGLKEVAGPGRLTKFLKVNQRFNGRKANPTTGLWIEPGRSIPTNHILRLPRVGVDYAGEWRNKLLRFKFSPENSI